MAHIEVPVTSNEASISNQIPRWWRFMTLTRDEWLVIRWLAPLAFLHTLIYVFLVPPWQHYDEPGHFLYTAYIIRGGVTAPDDVAIAREVADSMYRHRFWPLGVKPDLLSPLPPGIPTDQRHHPPFYYEVMAWLLSPLRYLPVEHQLYAGRMISAFLMMLTVVTVWRVGVIVFANEPQMAVILALLVATIPAFTDLMSAFNSDVLMNFAAVTAFLGFAILMRDGWRLTGLGLAILGTMVAVLTKRTAVPLLIPMILALIWSFWRRPIRWWVYLAGSVAFTSVLLMVSFTFDSQGLHPRPWLAMVEQEYLRVKIVPWLLSWGNWERAWPWYRLTLEVAHNHFWVRLAWGHIAVWPPVGDWLFAGLSIAAIVGLLRGIWQRTLPTPGWQSRWLWLCVVAVVIAWVALFGRLHPLGDGTPYIPRGRYLYWAMLPTTWLLIVGWRQLWPEQWRRLTLYILLVAVAIFDLAALLTLVRFYY